MKLKNIAFASAFVAGNLFVGASLANTTFNLTWQGVNNSASATGYVTFTDTSMLTTAASGSTHTIGNIVAYSITISGASIGNGTFGMSNITSAPIWTRFPLDLSQNLIGQTNGTYTFQAMILGGNSSGDFNIFSSGGSCSSSGAPGGQSPFQIYTGCDFINGDVLRLVSILSGSPISSVNLAPNAYALRSVYNIQSAALNAGLSYDCNVFDKEGFCLSTGGRYSTTNSPETSTTSGLLIGSYKYDKNIRVGAWVDQNLSTNNTDGVKLGNSKPLFGFFGAWAERTDGLGYEVKVSAGYGEKDVTITRDLVNEGEAQLKSKGIQTVSSFGIAIDSNWVASPYLGAKYVSIKRGGYAERGTNGLGYDAVTQETTSAVAGVSLKGKIDAQTFTVLSVGAEHDFSHNVSQYAAFSSNATVTSNAFNSNPQKTRPVVSAGVYYDLDKTQRLGLNATHRQEAFQSTATTSALATYTVGF